MRGFRPEERHVDLDAGPRGFEAPDARDAVPVRVRAGRAVAEGELCRAAPDVRVRPAQGLPAF